METTISKPTPTKDVKIFGILMFIGIIFSLIALFLSKSSFAFEKFLSLSFENLFIVVGFVFSFVIADKKEVPSLSKDVAFNSVYRTGILTLIVGFISIFQLLSYWVYAIFTILLFVGSIASWALGKMVYPTQGENFEDPSETDKDEEYKWKKIPAILFVCFIIGFVDLIPGILSFLSNAMNYLFDTNFSFKATWDLTSEICLLFLIGLTIGSIIIETTSRKFK